MGRTQLENDINSIAKLAMFFSVYFAFQQVAAEIVIS
jgi:hypothetical protein